MCPLSRGYLLCPLFQRLFHYSEVISIVVSIIQRLILFGASFIRGSTLVGSSSYLVGSSSYLVGRSSYLVGRSSYNYCFLLKWNLGLKTLQKICAA